VSKTFLIRVGKKYCRKRNQDLGYILLFWKKYGFGLPMCGAILTIYLLGMWLIFGNTPVLKLFFPPLCNEQVSSAE
jgi:hypothetical protein